MIKSIIDFQRANVMYRILCDNTKECLETIDQGKTGYCWLISAVDKILTDSEKENILSNVNFQRLIYWDKYERCFKLLSDINSSLLRKRYSEARELIRNFKLSDEGQWSMATNIVNKHGIYTKDDVSRINKLNTKELNSVLNYVIKGTGVQWLDFYRHHKITLQSMDKNFECLLEDVRNILKKYLPDAFGDGRIINNLSVGPYSSIISSNSDVFCGEYAYRVVLENNMIGGLPSVHYNVPMSEFYNLVKDRINRNITVWITCDAGKFLLWNKGIFDDKLFGVDCLSRGMMSIADLSRSEIKNVAIAGMCHALLIVGHVDDYFIIRNTRGLGFGNKGYGIMSRSWFEKFVFQAVVNSMDGMDIMKEKKVCDITAEQFYRNV